MAPNQLTAIVNGKELVVYEPLPHQQRAHESTAPNLLCLGTRGTGKSKWLRFDAILRCLMIPCFHALLVMRTMPDLRRTHLRFIGQEMRLLGGVFLQTTSIAKFHNGSTLTFTHCENESDLTDLLSAEYAWVGFEELSMFLLHMFLMFSASARVADGIGYEAVIRASSNPLGIGAEWMKSWFIDKDVRLEDYPYYHPDDFEMQFSTLEENPYISREQYEARLRNLPEHVRRAWLHGEFVMEGAYFSDFAPTKRIGDELVPWHVIDELPTLLDRRTGRTLPITDLDWIHVYRCLDWGYAPDPASCIWIAVLPQKRAIAFKAMRWTRTLAEEVAKAITRESKGYHVIETFCDPSMFIKTGNSRYSIGEIFEQHGVPLTESINKRDLAGYAIHSYLNTIIDGLPQLQMVRAGCPHLIRTLPTLRVDPADPRKIADGDDHDVMALSYFCMGEASPSHDPVTPTIPIWMMPKAQARRAMTRLA